MSTIRHIIGQPIAKSFRLKDRETSEYRDLTGYEFTFDLNHVDTGASVTYVVPASTTTSASFDIDDLISPLVPGHWFGRINITLNGDPYNVSVELYVVII